MTDYRIETVLGEDYFTVTFPWVPMTLVINCTRDGRVCYHWPPKEITWKVDYEKHHGKVFVTCHNNIKITCCIRALDTLCDMCPDYKAQGE